MGFRVVYKVLQEVFPQVDARVLRAVAIEHAKDPDAAVEVVLVEVIPFLSKQSTSPGSLDGDGSSQDLSNDSPRLDNSVNGPAFVNDGRGRLENCEESSVADPHMPSNVMPSALNCANGTIDDPDQVSENSEIRSVMDFEKPEPLGASVQLLTVEDRDDGQDRVSGNSESSAVIDFKKPEPISVTEQDTLEMEHSLVQLNQPPAQNSEPDAPESDHELTQPDMPVTDFENPESNGVSDAAAFHEDTTTRSVADLEGDFTGNTVVTRSGQIYSVDLIDAIIEDARSNKRVMVEEVESVISLMREVELQERAAEQAKDEASRGGFDILSKVEELKQQLQLAKNANEMHSGEVYGEKSILATEVKELQSRLLSLSDERDKSLAILDEMRQTLEERLSAAEKEMKAAEQEKADKEDFARNLLAQQSLVMERVVHESKILMQEAEENSKLREFLMDRGRVVDILQGEIHVKCQDVRSLKEKFDERIPLSKFLSASQTARFLSSPSSSFKSTEPDQTHELAAEPSSDGHLSSGEERRDDLVSPEDESAMNENNELNEDGWELFRNDKASDGFKEKAVVDDDGWELFDSRGYKV